MSNNSGRGEPNPKKHGKGLNQDKQSRMKTGKTMTMTMGSVRLAKGSGMCLQHSAI